MAGNGNDFAALIDYMGLEIIPEDAADANFQLAMGFVPEGKAGEEIFKGTDALRRHNKVVRDVVTKL
jgi:hypothetical protein